MHLAIILKNYIYIYPKNFRIEQPKVLGLLMLFDVTRMKFTMLSRQDKTRSDSSTGTFRWNGPNYPQLINAGRIRRRAVKGP